MDVTITINKSEVMTEVYKITGYTGVKSGDVDKISSTEDESNILDSYYKEAMGNLSDVISSFGTISDDTVSFTLPPNWKESAKSSLQINLSNFLVNFICLKWFNLTNKNDVEYYNEVVNSKSANIVKLLCERKRPIR